MANCDDNRAPAGRRWWKNLSPLMVVLPLAAFAVTFMWGGPAVTAESEAASPIVPANAAVARQLPVSGVDQPGRVAGSEAARFTICDRGPRVNCVVDGDTFWYHSEKIRIADINTPEVSRPECAAEARLGALATDRLQGLLNAGPFALERVDRDRDRYDRLLRVVTRGGESLGAVLVAEGLAEEWQGRRGSWC